MKALIKNSFAILTLIFTALLGANIAWAMPTVELKQPNSNKVVFKIRFNNGSIDDPAGKEGLTFATASLMAQGGAGGISYADIQD